MQTLLGRTRLMACLVSIGVVAAHAWPLLTTNGDPIRMVASMAALCLLLVVLALTLRLQRPVVLEPVLVPALLVVVGAGLDEPLRILTITIAVYAPLALHGSARAWLIRTALGLAIMPGSVALAEALGGAGPSWHSAEVLGMVPFVLPVGLVMRNIRRILTQQELISNRDALLSTAGSRILAATDVEEVRAIGADLSGRLLEQTPGTLMIVIRPEPDGLRVLRSLGTEKSIRGDIVPPEAVEDPLTYFAALAPRTRHWHVEASTDRYLLLGSIRPVPEDVLVAFRNLLHQVVLGETSRRVLAELQHRAHHDDLTQLANRELFRQRLDAALAEAPPGSVALCNVDLNDFKQVNDTFGHAAGDELLIEVAHQLRAAAGDNGLAARLGGDEFALLLTGLSGPEEADRRAAELSARLDRPVHLGAATVRISASVGVAATTPSDSAADLMRRADTSMYSAKVAGKNRVERFIGERRGSEEPPEPDWSVPAWSGSGTHTP